MTKCGWNEGGGGTGNEEGVREVEALPPGVSKASESPFTYTSVVGLVKGTEVVQSQSKGQL